MQKTVVKYLTIFLFLLVYINRSIFIAPSEIENCKNKEINTVIEWVAQLVTGKSNDIDEDGDSQTDCNSVKTISYVYYQEFANYLDLLKSYSKKIEKNTFPNEENIPQKEFFFQIDHPPQWI